MSGATAKARGREEKEVGIVKISSAETKEKTTAAAGGGFRKGGFKSAFGAKTDGANDMDTSAETTSTDVQATDVRSGAPASGEVNDSEDDYELYDPRRPTGCGSNCKKVLEAVL